MSRPPAYVFIVRHGNRLDAADKQWHLTSPTPYDPPLTYGGWLQCKALGARIASILRNREAEDEAIYAAAQSNPDGADGQPRRRRRYKVILHSSPFLRCIQTSIAISAGLASSPTASKTGARPLFQSRPSRVNQVSSFSNPAPTRTRPTITTDMHSPVLPEPSNHVDKTILRLDPFLGEWASPDYFDHITPPPESSLMIMTAKAELLRRENHVTYPQYNTRIDTPTTPSQLWNSPTQTQNSGLDTIPQIGDALPGSSGDPTTQRRGNHKPSLSEPAISTGYSAPIPSYAVSPSEPIPVGYVAHARDACVDIDYQWDSTRDPVAWGEGGVLPEEWAGMHQRFRKGLKRLIDWYSTAEHPGQMVTKIPTAHTPVRLNGNGNHECAVEEDEFDTENVVILVSHGAGCNALVGGVTNQPVLADVPMASLTIAKRRPAFDETKNPVDERVMASLDDGLSRNKLTVPDLYELRMFASIDHLTGGSGAVSRSSSINAGSRGRDSRNSGSVLRDINFGAHYGQPQDNRSNSVTLTLGDVRRASAGINPGARSISLVSSGGIKGGITVGSGMKSFGTAPRTTSFGMWTPRQEARDPVEEPDLPMTLDFSHEKESSKKSPEPIVEVPELETEHLPVLQPPAQSEEHDDFKVITSPSLSSGSGMWGVPRPPDDAERMRDFSSQKRRWTVTERQPVVHRS